MRTLISMCERLDEIDATDLPADKKWEEAMWYREFIGKALNLEIIVSCNDKGEPMGEPDWGKHTKSTYEDAMEIYVEAKKKVIFEGFYHKETGIVSVGKPYHEGGEMIGVYPNINGEFAHSRFETIEDLTPLGLKYREI